MPILIPTGGDFGPVGEFGAGLMQGVALHRERARQEQLAVEAQRRAQQFQMEMDQQRNAVHDRRVLADREWQGMRDNALFARDRQAKGEDYARNLADKQAEERTKLAGNAQRADQLQTVLEAGGALPAQQDMPDGVQGPGLRMPRLTDPTDVHAAASAYGSKMTREAANADRDAARADREAYQQGQLDLGRQRVEASKAGKGAMSPEQRQKTIGALMAIHGYDEETANHFADLLEGKAIAMSQVAPIRPDQTPEAKIAWEKVQSAHQAYEKLLGQSQERISKNGPAMLDAIAKAEAEYAKIAQPRQAAGRGPAMPKITFPPEIVTPEDRAEYERLFRGNVDGGGP